MNNTPMKFYKPREFSDFINDMIEVIKQNYKHLLRIFLIYGITPLFLSLLIAFGFGMAALNVDSALLIGLGGISVLTLVAGYVIATTLVMASSFSFLRGLAEGKTATGAYEQVKREAVGGAAKIFLFSLLISLVVSPVGLVFYFLVSSRSIFLLLFLALIFSCVFIYFFIRLSLATYIITIPGASFGEAIRESMKLVENRWWVTFGLYAVVAVICIILAAILKIPGLIVVMFGGLFATSTGVGESVAINSFIFSTFLEFVAGLLRIIIMAVFVSLLYSSWHEMYYGSSIHEEIDNLDEVRKEDSFFENEGEL